MLASLNGPKLNGPTTRPMTLLDREGEDPAPMNH